ncbi:hypothetical protein A2130_04785 [Candidatus Woesebacteria bacterium GWC2_33_12]|uniref:Uncharacterized protein n=1 Tax=Candidatus Woesebacteria bacterium GW2011_GWB1_33_22 TaxID=1618566 RepID=A0A0G0C1V2_9BACT|nr:MAG: hypothetical protein UR29_C0005G0053 [Candidatus Woesebacteria bacterium GW2011_GWC2_33_12]KKP42359.1 MAG: hypothetical protein UR33_C0003G0052 [Candidatus Woesebacteria bacterium GW2011_GWA2_33_20]KKP45110.1 MAG: hypothetical protein UR35_C0003G0052 [Candidatus Woesebacteria bacterium GW2011_GWB1_33_22]KKP46986.1 MAG: hypothetical protein UR37_C0003G0052 [Microgenomates group bacterium GW2011_GWC1_33_28]KKP50812.1 MAG: hypothetical protein UR41_C0003G0052 [Candidatus Woesebacteria bact
MARSLEKIEAIKLRKQGLSIKFIAKKINVSVSSVSTWVRDVVLTKDQFDKLAENARNPYYGNRLKYINKIKKLTNQKIDRLKKEGIKDVGSLSKRELFLVGVALYWGEGFKKDSQVGFANSDPKMIKLFLKWLDKCFRYGVNDFSVRVTLNISHADRINEVQNYWSKEVEIPISNFRKPFYQNVKWQKVYEHPNEYFGVLRVKVLKSKDFLRKIYGFIEGLRLQAD